MPRAGLSLWLAAGLGFALEVAAPPTVRAQALGDPFSPPAAHGLDQYWGGTRTIPPARTAPVPVAVTPDVAPTRPAPVVPERPAPQPNPGVMTVPTPAPSPRLIPAPGPTPAPSPRAIPAPSPTPLPNPRPPNPRVADPGMQEIARMDDEIRRLMRAGDSAAAKRLASERELRLREQQRLQRERAEQLRQCRAARTC